ncbi:MAG: hypothetical protein ACLFQJ_04695, partial [Campylobacterales bacterium]
MAQLGFIQGGDVYLYHVTDLKNPIATTKTSSSTDPANAGSFKFENVDISDSSYYVIKITGGYDIDPLDTGTVDLNNKKELKGDLRLVIKGSDISSGDSIKANVLSDMVYQRVAKSIESDKNFADLDSELESIAKEFFGSDSNYKEIYSFDPTKSSDKAKLLLSYKNLLDNYVPLKYDDDKGLEKISMLYLNEPKIVIENGEKQKIPFELNAKLNYAPNETTVKYFINDEEVNTLSKTVEKDGHYRLEARVYDEGEELLYSTSSFLYAYEEKELAKIKTSKESDSVLFSDDENQSVLLEISSDALNTDEEIVIKSQSINNIKNSSLTGVSKVLKMEPEGLQFDRPVAITMSVDKSILMDSDVELLVARHSGGETDYIEPSFINYDTGEVTFHTMHFSEFQIGFIFDEEYKIAGDKTKSTDIIKNVETITGLDYDEDTWVDILNTKVFDNSDITVFQLYKDYETNKKIDKYLKDTNKVHGHYL